MKTKEEVIFLNNDQATDLVERIAERTENFDYIMSEPEKSAMAQLLSDIGTRVSDIIDVSNLADNYAINAEIVRPEDYKNYNMKEVKQDALFQWEEDGKTFYCLSW
jgi:hypothetical protein